MEFFKTKIPDVILCKPTIISDERGYFMESFRHDKFEAFIGKKIQFVQDNEAKSSRGVLRGLHFQLPPFAQSKLVRVIKGAVLDVVVDMRKTSITFGKHIAVELSERNKHQLFVPKGFAHGYLVLEDETIFSYKVDALYNRESERGVLYSDEFLAIDWTFELNKLIISEKDTVQPPFLKADYF